MPTANGSPLPFTPLDTLRQMPDADLAALFDQIPTDRQRTYKAMYDRHLREEGVTVAVGSDALEKEVLLSLLQQYVDTALVPAGEVWVQTADYVQQKARRNESLITAESTAKPTVAPLAVIGLAAVAMVACLALILLLRGRGGRSTALVGTHTVTPTVTPVHSPTPTPLALENQDSIIRGGDNSSDRSLSFPVLLKVQNQTDTQPRVFVVQRRAIQTAQWDFDSNPDIASFINGLTVRPVLGIPWSPENADFFSSLANGTVFTLQMNTGANLQYTYASGMSVNRSDTSIFKQSSTGLVLVLIGERDEQGQTTAQRPVILADYRADTDLARSIGASLLPTLTPTPAATPVDRVNVELVSILSQPSQVSVTLRIYNARQAPLHFTADSLWIAFGYTAHPLGPHLPAEGLQPFDLLPGQAANLTVTFPWSGEPFLTLGTDGLGEAGNYQFAAQLVGTH